MIIYKKFKKQKNRINNSLFIAIGRLFKNSFVRNRKLTLTKMIVFILTMKGVTLRMEIENFLGLMGGKMEDVSKSAICQQRANLNPEVFRKLMRSYIEDTYDEGNDYDRYKGYIVTAIDGSKIELPNVLELQKDYGISGGRKDQRPCAQALASCIYDVVNNMVIDSQIAELKASEKELAKKNIENMISIFKHNKLDLSKVIIIFDRGYPSTELLGYLDLSGVKYILRLGSNKFKENVKAMKGKDDQTKIKITKSRLNGIRDKELKSKLEKKEYIGARLVKYELNTGEEEILITNLDKEEFETKEIGQLYYERWKIELAYDIAKNKLEIQNFGGHSKLFIEQEFYAHMYLLNIAEDLRKEANKKVKAKKENGYKYDYKVNMNIVIGIMRKELIEILIRAIFFKVRDTGKRYDKMIEKIGKEIVPIRPDRTNPRKKFKTRSKYRCNMRRNS